MTTPTTENALLSSSASFGADDATDKSIVLDEEPREKPEKDAAAGQSSNVFGDIAVFRDFFLAAFSDGYYNVACCGSEGLFPGGGCTGNGCLPQYSSARVAPMDASTSTNSNSRVIGIASSSNSQHSNSNNLQLQSSGSREGPSSSSQSSARKRPLAVAVGFKYAEDMEGRPVVITPGNRRMTVQERRSPPGSPASQTVHNTPSKTSTSPSMHFPLDRSAERPPMQQLSYRLPPQNH